MAEKTENKTVDIWTYFGEAGPLIATPLLSFSRLLPHEARRPSKAQKGEWVELAVVFLLRMRLLKINNFLP